MKKISLLLFIIFAASFQLGFAQREASNWYFGRNAGLRFNADGSVTPLLDGQLNTNEGCASISDRFGDLLFYTDGITVWDRTHNIMPGGTGLLGNPSSSQSAIIVPQPGNNNIYFIFTVHALGGANNDTSQLLGLNFYTVDLSVGPNGSVVNRGNNDQPLIIPNSEKITAVRSADCSSIWVISHFENSFYAYNVNTAGVNTTPVISATPTLVPLSGYRFNAIGYLKASPNGERLAIAHSTISNTPDRQSSGGLLVYDFDAATGVVSNEIILDADNGAPYGVEFSPNNNLLYASVDFITPTTNTNSVFQYDLTATDISASRVLLSSGAPGALQLAPNGRIYHANGFTNSLSVIENPNVQGTGANFMVGAQPLSGRTSTFGLPPFIQSLFNEVVNITGLANIDGTSLDDVELCQNDSFTFRAPVFPGATYSWFFDDGTIEIQLACNTEECALVNAQLADAGIFRVEIDRMDGSCPIEGFGFVTVNPLPSLTDSSLLQCDVDPGNSTDGITIFNLEQAIDNITGGVTDLSVEFFQNNAALIANTPIPNPIGYQNTTPFNEFIIARVTNQNGCVNTAQLELIVQPTTTSLPVIGPFFNCETVPGNGILSSTFDLDAIRTNNYPATLDVAFYLNLNDAALEINEVSGTDFNTQTTTVFVRIENANQCQGIEQFDLIVDPAPIFSFPEQLQICLNQLPRTLFAPAGFDSYSWFFNQGGTEIQIATGPQVNIDTTGEYRLEIGIDYNDSGVNRTCFNSAVFNVTASNIATIVDIQVNDLSSNNTIIVEVEGEGDYEFALNDINGPYQLSNVFENVSPGFATVFVRDRNGCGIVEQIVSVIGFPNFFTPNGDGVNDRWQISGLNGQFQPSSNIFIFDRFGKLLIQLQPGSEGWDGTFNGRPLPQADYWFRLQLEDGRDITGHFSLVR